MSNERPVHELRMGRCKCAIWKNETDSGTRFNVTFARIFKQTEDSQWESTGSFGRDDLPLVAKLADQAHTWIFEQTATNRDEHAPADSSPRNGPSKRSFRTASTSR